MKHEKEIIIGNQVKLFFLSCKTMGSWLWLHLRCRLVSVLFLFADNSSKTLNVLSESACPYGVLGLFVGPLKYTRFSHHGTVSDLVRVRLGLWGSRLQWFPPSFFRKKTKTLEWLSPFNGWGVNDCISEVPAISQSVNIIKR